MKIHRLFAQSASHAGRKRTEKRLNVERLEAKQLLSADGLPGLTELGAAGDRAGEVAQMSTVLSHTHQNATSAQSFTGRVGPIVNDGEFRVENPRDQWATFRYNDTTQVVNAAGRNVNLDDLEGIKVHVSYHDEGALQVADKVEVCRVQVKAVAPRMNIAEDVPLVPLDSTIDATRESSSFVGRVTQVENDGEVRVENGKGEWETFTYDENTEVVDASGANVPLDELEGVKVRVSYHSEGTKQVADKIQVCRYQVTAAELRSYFRNGDDTQFGLRNPSTLARAAELRDQLFARGGRWYL